MSDKLDWPMFNRERIGQLIVCNAGTCGNPDKNAIPVPIEKINNTINDAGMKKQFKFTVSKCLGVCKPHNVSTVLTTNKQYWFGMFRDEKAYELLLDWIVKSGKEGKMLDLPDNLKKYTFERFIQNK